MRPLFRRHYRNEDIVLPEVDDCLVKLISFHTESRMEDGTDADKSVIPVPRRLPKPIQQPQELENLRFILRKSISQSQRGP